jgi:two-component system C4-dicarboxylate transport sensor histidine kinase DctB
MSTLTAPEGPTSSEDLRRAHQRFARAALGLYLIAATVGVVLLVGFAMTERGHEVGLLAARLQNETRLRAQQLARQLGVLGGELRRLGLRSEVDLLDADMSPEQSLLRLAHGKSTFFNLGVAIVDAGGRVLWSEPQGFLPMDTTFGGVSWFEAQRHRRGVSIVPVHPERSHDSLIYLVSPIVRNDGFTGALVGGVDLSRAGPLDVALEPTRSVQTVLVGRDGRVAYPPDPPPAANDPGFTALVERVASESRSIGVDLAGVPSIAAGVPVAGTDLVLLAIVPEVVLEAPARARMVGRIAIGMVLALVPFVLLLVLLQRSIRTFRAAEQSALRLERLRLVGEASNLIAHEVKNGLNSLRLGLDLVTSNPARSSPRVTEELRREMDRLSQFAGDLMLFSKGVVPRPAAIDLGELAEKVVTLAGEAAAELGVTVSLARPTEPVTVAADANLVHTVIINLVGNAADALAARAGAVTQSVTVTVGTEPEAAFVRVRDEGPGVAPEVRDRLFEPFVTGKPNGVGIGLALSRQIARAHGGDLVLEDTAVGASFVLRLPRRSP